MTWALDHDHADVVALLLENVPGSVNEVLMTGAREGNAALVKVALAKTITPDNLTAALAAASDGDPNPRLSNY
jgi:hypothetical protein